MKNIWNINWVPELLLEEKQNKQTPQNFQPTKNPPKTITPFPQTNINKKNPKTNKKPH